MLKSFSLPVVLRPDSGWWPPFCGA